MTLTIDLSPETEAHLQAEAARLGLDARRFAQNVLEERFGGIPADASGQDGQPPMYARSLEEWKRAFRQWGEAHDRDTPEIPLEALRREYLYEDRW